MASPSCTLHFQCAFTCYKDVQLRKVDMNTPARSQYNKKRNSAKQFKRLLNT